MGTKFIRRAAALSVAVVAFMSTLLIGAGHADVVDLRTTDMQVSIQASRTAVLVKQKIDLTYTVHNAGPYDATNVSLSVTLPDSFAIRNLSWSTGSCNTSGSDLSCTLASLPVGQNMAVTMVARPQHWGSFPTDAKILFQPGASNQGHTSDSLTITASHKAETAREQHAWNAMNALRTSQGLAALSWNDQLHSCAQAWANKMMQNSAPQDEGPGLGNCAPGNWYLLGDNTGHQDYKFDIVQAWMSSCDHRANINYPYYTDAAIAIVYDDRDFTEWWVADFGDYDPGQGQRVAVVQNDCFEDGWIGSADYNKVVSAGKWFTYHDSSVGGTWAGRAQWNGAPSGDYVMRVQGGNGAGGHAAATQLVQVTPGAHYNMTGMAMYANGVGAEQLKLNFLDANRNPINGAAIWGTANPSNAYQWQQISVPYGDTVTAPSNAAYAQIIIYAGPYAGNFAWDDVVLQRS